MSVNKCSVNSEISEFINNCGTLKYEMCFFPAKKLFCLVNRQVLEESL